MLVSYEVVRRVPCVLVMLATVSALVLQPLPARVPAAGTGSALTCVPLDNVPFVPAGEEPHHVTGTGARLDPLGFFSFVSQGTVPAGQVVDLRLEITNSGDTPAIMSFPTTQRYDVVVWNDDCMEVWRWSKGRMFAQIVTSLYIHAHGHVVFHVPWPQRDQAGRQVRMGGYEARVVFLGTWPHGETPVVLPPLTIMQRLTTLSVPAG